MEKEKTQGSYIDLNELPRFKGGNGVRIDWSKSLGYKIPFTYKSIIGEIEISGYNADTKMITIKYNNKVFTEKPISVGNLRKCKLGYYLGLKSSGFKVEIGQIFNDEKRDMIVTDRKYIIDKSDRSRKYLKYTCNKCGWTEGWIIEGSLLKGVGCSCCNSKTVVEGINSIWKTHPWMIDLGVSIEDAKTHLNGSHKNIKVKCPDCGREKKIKVIDIYRNKSIGCICGDGISYPEKFIVGILTQLNVDFETQLGKKTFEWCSGKRYDFYIPSLNMIIETHGRQHYESGCWGLKIEDVKANDKLKRDLALANGIDKYIVIDCRYSDMEYLKNSILNSKLNELFDLSNIDWLKCEEYALKNIAKEVCEYWNNKEEWETVSDVADKFNCWGITIINYLKRGTKLGWCEYLPKRKIKKDK